MKKLFLTLLLAVPLLFGTAACEIGSGKSDPKPVEKPAPKPDPQPTPPPAPTPQPAPNPSPAPAPAPPPTVDTDRAMQNLVNTINTVGRSTGINISNIKVYSEDQQAKTYNGLFSNKFGFGITIYKSNGSIGAIAIVGSGTSQEQIKSFYSTISTVIRSLDSPLSEQDVESILEKLGSKDLSAKRYSTQAIGGTLTVSENNGMLMFQAIHN